MPEIQQTGKARGKPQHREPISLAPLPFEEALSDLLKTRPHPKEKPLPQKKQRPKGADAKKD